MMSEAFRLSVVSDPDVEITVHDGAGQERLNGTGAVAEDLPRGLYRLHLERCGSPVEHVITHNSPKEWPLAGPLVDSAAPVVFARDAEEHAEAARRLSALRGDQRPLGNGQGNARLFVFVRRVQRGQRGQRDPMVPSDPVAIHDMSGRPLAALAPAGEGETAPGGYAALSFPVAAGTYRLRVGRARRDLAITIPAGRAAHVFLADRGAISLRTARIYLPRADEAFDPGGDIARATESVLWALGLPDGELPRVARALLSQVDRDLAFGIACAHVAWRQRDRAAFDQIMEVLRQQASDLPDVAILERTCVDRDGPSPILSVPPLFRTSLVQALDSGLAIASRSVFADAAKAAFEDSVLCTWSPRWSDERWIAPMVEQVRNAADRSPTAIAEVARLTRLTPDIVARTVDQLDAMMPHIAGSPVRLDELSIPGYVLGERLRHGDHSTVLRACRERDAVDAAVKIVPLSDPASCESVAGELTAAAQRLAHAGVVAFQDCGVLPGAAGVWLAMELCDESLFDRITARGAMPYDEACAATLRLLETLGDLHRRGAVHGAIDPGSLLVRKGGAVVLGLPGPAPAASDADDLDSDRLRFVAPEVAGGSPATASSDVWSMAAALYFLITLELPRERYAEQSPLDAARDNPYVPIGVRLPQLPGGLAACLARAMSPAVGSRFRDAQEFHDALSNAVPAARAVRIHDDLIARDPGYAATLRNLMLRLTAVVDGELIRQRVVRGELTYPTPEENARVVEVLKRFQAANLVAVFDGTDGHEHRMYVDVVHSELLHGWSRIARWHEGFDVGPDTRSSLAALADSVRAWVAQGRDTSLLWHAPRVEQVREIALRARFAFNAAVADFLQCSEEHRRGARVRVVAAVAAVVIVSGGLIWWREMAINGEAAEARQTLARTLQETGRQHVLEGRPLQALAYLAAAGETAPPGPALQMLFREASWGLPLTPALEHDGFVTSAAFSPDAARVVSTSRDGTATVWDARTGMRITRLRREKSHGPGAADVDGRAHDLAVLAAAFSRDGARIVTGSEDWTAAVWDAATGLPVLSPLDHAAVVLQHAAVVQSVMFSPDGKYVLTASADHTARIWNAATGAVIRELAHRDAVMTAAFSADGSRVVTASADRTASIWDTSTGSFLHALEHDGKVLSATFSADGMRVVTASQDRTARIWDVASGKRLVSIAHPDRVTGASFDGRGECIVTTSEKLVRVWSAATGAAITPWLEHRGAVASAVFSPEGARVVTASAAAIASAPGTARIWDARTGALILPMFEHTDAVTQAAFDASGTRVVTASADGTARIWTARTDAASVVLGSDGVRAAAFRGDGTEVVTVNGSRRIGGTAQLWNTRTGRHERTLAATSVLTVAFSVDGSRVVTASADRSAQVWDAATGRALGPRIELPERATSVTFSPDGNRFLTTSESDVARWSATLRLWETATGAPIGLPLPYDANVVQASLNDGATRLATFEQDRSVRVWDAVSGRPISPRLELPDGVANVAFSPDGARVVTAGADQVARIWDTTTGKRLAVLEDTEPVKSALFSPDGERVVTLSGDRTVQVWDAVTGKPLTQRLRQTEEIVAVAFTTDGSQLLVMDGRSVRTWDVGLDARSASEWTRVAKRSPYVLDDGVLTQRSLAPRRTGNDVVVRTP